MSTVAQVLFQADHSQTAVLLRSQTTVRPQSDHSQPAVRPQSGRSQAAVTPQSERSQTAERSQSAVRAQPAAVGPQPVRSASPHVQALRCDAERCDANAMSHCKPRPPAQRLAPRCAECTPYTQTRRQQRRATLAPTRHGFAVTEAAVDGTRAWTALGHREGPI